MKKQILLKSMMLLCMLMVGMGAWAESYTWTSASGNLGSSGSANTSPTLNGVNWSATMSDATYIGWASNHIQLGSKNNPTNYTLTTSAFNDKKITGISFDGYSYNGAHTYDIKVGGVSKKSGSTLSATGTISTGTIAANGEIEISFSTESGSRALYIKSITITYERLAADEPYTVTFDAGSNGTCGTTSIIETSANAGVILPNVTANTGYSFQGWSTSETPTSVDAGVAGSTFHPSEDCTLYAYYKPLYNIIIETPENGTLVMKDGETPIASGTQVEAGTVLTAEVSPASGYKMRNWQAVDATTHTYTSSFTYTVNSNVTFKANFEVIPTYTINYMVNGVNTNAQVEVDENTALEFPTPSTINGKKFVGWIIDPATVANPSYVNTTGLKATQNITYYAVFAEEITTTFNPNDITDTPLTGTLTWTDSNTGVALKLSAGQLYTSGSPKTFTVTAGTSNYFQITSSDIITKIVTTISTSTYKINKTVTGASLTTNGTTQTITSSTLKDIKAYATSNNQIRATSIVVTTLGNYTLAPLGTGTISVSSVRYTTYFTDAEFTMPEGLEGYVVTPKNATSVTLTKAFEGGETVPASTALLVKGAQGNYNYNITNTGATFSGENCLHGNLTTGTVAAVPGASKYYKLLNGSNGLGWYLGAEDGGVFSLGANKAYLALTDAQAGNAKSLSVEFDDVTGITNVAADAENTRVYNLNGQRVNANTKGIVIVNGKKMLNK